MRLVRKSLTTRRGKNDSKRLQENRSSDERGSQRQRRTLPMDGDGELSRPYAWARQPEIQQAQIPQRLRVGDLHGFVV